MFDFVSQNVTSPYSINNLQPGTHYDIFVIAENQYGSSQSSEVFIAWTARESMLSVTQKLLHSREDLFYRP